MCFFFCHSFSLDFGIQWQKEEDVIVMVSIVSKDGEHFSRGKILEREKKRKIERMKRVRRKQRKKNIEEEREKKYISWWSSYLNGYLIKSRLVFIRSQSKSNHVSFFSFFFPCFSFSKKWGKRGRKKKQKDFLTPSPST